MARKNLCQHTLNMRQTCVLYLISDSLRYGIAYVSPGACKKAGVQTACLQQHLDSIKALRTADNLATPLQTRKLNTLFFSPIYPHLSKRLTFSRQGRRPGTRVPPRSA